MSHAGEAVTLSSFKGSPGEVSLLPFTLLADSDHKTADDYGVWVEKNMYGKKRMGIKRLTFVIDADRNVARAMYGVKPEGHADEVLEVLPG